MAVTEPGEGKTMVDNNGNGAAVPPQPPARHILTCTEGTLKLWREKCAERIGRLEAEIEGQRGGIDQIDAELAKRAAEKKARTRKVQG